MVSSSLELHRYATDRQTRVVTALTMLKTHLFKWVPSAIAHHLSLNASQRCLCHTLRAHKEEAKPGYPIICIGAAIKSRNLTRFLAY